MSEPMMAFHGLQQFLTIFEPDDVVAAVTCDNVITKISIVLSIAGVWIINWQLTSELVEFLEFVGIVSNHPLLGLNGAQYQTEVWAKTK
jgi:hypothetical protein